MSRRSLLSTALDFTFVPVAVPGVWMLFHIHFPGIKDIHDRIGLAFVIVGVFHLLINWKPFQGYRGKADTHRGAPKQP